MAALAACAGNPNAPPAEYDFGIGGATLEEPARLRREIAVAEATAPAWLDSPAIVYRLAYRDAAQPRAYVESRWVAPPAALFTAQLRQRLVATTRSGVLVPGDGVRTDRDAARRAAGVQPGVRRTRAQPRGRSRARRARLRRAPRRPDELHVDRPASSPDAAGGARALALAADAAIDRLIDWTADALK